MHAVALLVTWCVIAGSMLSAANQLTPQLGKVFQEKIVLVQQQAETRSETARTTSFSEFELNSYLRFDASHLLPTGLTEPSMTLLADGRVSARAVVDLDIVRQQQGSGSWFDPTSYLTGKLPVSATGIIVSGEGQGRFAFETVEVSGVRVPRALLAQMVNYFTRTLDNPQGSSIDDTFDLPAGIRRIGVDAGRFFVIQ